MKRKLGQISRQYHKEHIPLKTLRPEIETIFNQLCEISSDSRGKDFYKNMDMIANMVTTDVDFSNRILQWARENKTITEQIYTAGIKSLCNKNLIDIALQTLTNMVEDNIQPHIRTMLPFYQGELSIHHYMVLHKFISEIGLTPDKMLFSLMISRFPKSGSQELFYSLIQTSGQYCNYLDPVVLHELGLHELGLHELGLHEPNYQLHQTQIDNNGKCVTCHEKLATINLSQNQRKRMIESVFSEKDGNIIRWMKTRNYDVVIDGANVAHYNNSPFDKRKVINMVNKMVGSKLFHNKKILIVFALCRRKYVKQLETMWKNVDVFYSRFGTNDDLSWLYAALVNPNCLCVTNDQMRDHVYYKFTEVVGRNVIDLWLERQVVRFDFIVTKARNRHNVHIKLELPSDYSIRPQVQNNSTNVRFHMPVEDMGWYCGSY